MQPEKNIILTKAEKQIMLVRYIETLGRCGAATPQRLSFSLFSLPAGSCPEPG